MEECSGSTALLRSLDSLCASCSFKPAYLGLYLPIMGYIEI